MKVLVIDDDKWTREALQEMVQQCGHDPLSACNGRDGAEAVRTHTPESALCDLKMPVLDGLGFLREIQAVARPPRVIMLTAYGDVSSAVQALQQGARDYVLKPISLEDLRARLVRIEEEHEMERSLAEQRRHAALSARLAAVSQLAAGMCHEINNPVTYVRGHTQRLEQYCSRFKAAMRKDPQRLRQEADAFCQEAPDLLAAMVRGTERIGRITHGLLRFADSRVAEPMVPTCLNACVADALLFCNMENEAPVEIVQHLGDDLPILTLGRRDVTQAILCLILNAVRAAKESSAPTVHVRTERDCEVLRLIVEDSGPGVPDELRERIFDPFFTTRDVGEGVGLGLSVAYSIIVGDHDGRIRLSDSSLGGARFAIELPLVPCPAFVPDASVRADGAGCSAV